MTALSFRELTVWQKSMELAKRVYKISKRLPFLLTHDIYAMDLAEELQLLNEVQKMLQVMGSRLLKPIT